MPIESESVRRNETLQHCADSSQQLRGNGPLTEEISDLIGNVANTSRAWIFPMFGLVREGLKQLGFISGKSERARISQLLETVGENGIINVEAVRVFGVVRNQRGLSAD